jgi:hypothetical protein
MTNRKEERILVMCGDGIVRAPKTVFRMGVEMWEFNEVAHGYEELCRQKRYGFSSLSNGKMLLEVEHAGAEGFYLL